MEQLAVDWRAGRSGRDPMGRFGGRRLRGQRNRADQSDRNIRRLATQLSSDDDGFAGCNDAAAIGFPLSPVTPAKALVRTLSARLARPANCRRLRPCPTPSRFLITSRAFPLRSSARSSARRSAASRGEARLDAGLWRLSSSLDRPVQLYVRNSFLDAEECRQLCGRIDAGSLPSPLYDKESYEDVRTSYSCNLDAHDPLIASVETRIADCSGSNGLGRAAPGPALRRGQRFKEHADFFYVDQPYWAEYEPHGGQRTWTAMIYLNHPESGRRDRLQISRSRDRTSSGGCSMWNNMAIDGSPNPWTTHEGRPVEAGANISSPNGIASGSSSDAPNVP